MILKWSEQGWEDYVYWKQTDKKIIKRINKLIEDIKRLPFAGLGNPAPLKYNWSGFWARRIDQDHRLVYAVENNEILIAQYRYHY